MQGNKLAVGVLRPDAVANSLLRMLIEREGEDAG